MRRHLAAILLGTLFFLGLIPTATADVSAATLLFGGDLLIQSELLQAAFDKADQTYDFAPMLAPVADLLAGADLTVLNLEVPVASGKFTGKPRFNSPPALLSALKSAGVDLLLCANNHALDQLGKGARETLDSVDAAGLSHVGTARDEAEYDEIPIFDVNGIRVAILNYTKHTNNMEKQDKAKNLRNVIHYFDLEEIGEDIRAARGAGADYVVVCVHWGKEYERKPADSVRRWAQALCALGADLVVGGHPHVLQTYEWLAHTDDAGGDTQKTFVLYSTGNFLSGQRDRYTDSGALFRFTLAKDNDAGTTRLVDYKYIPTWVWLREDTGEYQVLDMRTARMEPPDGMSGKALARLHAAWEETVGLMDEEFVLPLKQ